MSKPFTFKVAGPAGFGIKAVGTTFSKIATRSGYSVYGYSEYPSLIRGGHNTVQCTFALETVYFTYQTTDFLIAFDQSSINLHAGEMTPGSGVLFDSGLNLDTSKLSAEVTQFGIPLMQLTKDNGGIEVMRDILAMGAVMALLGSDLTHLNELITEAFSKKKAEVVETNIKLAKIGFDFATENFAQYIKQVLTQQKDVAKQILVTANEAIALGAIQADMKFAAIYPMTPTSSIVYSLARLQDKYGFVFKQPEDEISAIGMAIGAAHAGARSMVATSGGGFCLMTEAYGLAGITETPVVIIEGMRGGPATGLPTWTEQGDLRMILSAHQSDFPRIVLLAGDAKEAFEMTRKAFNLADIYQTPVVVVVDKIMCEDDQSFTPFVMGDYVVDRGKYTTEIVADYKRFADSEDGISLRSPVGVGNYFNANADEHNEYGYSDEEADNRIVQMNKRMKKLETCAKTHMEAPVLYGPADAEITIVSWGSNKSSILEAMKFSSGVNYLHITWANPFPADAVQKYLEKAKHVIDIECNFSGHMASIIREHTGIKIDDRMLRYDGRPFYPEQIIEKIESIQKGRQA